MNETDIYQLVGRAYCNGMAHGLEKAAAFNPATALGRDGIYPYQVNAPRLRDKYPQLFNSAENEEQNTDREPKSLLNQLNKDNTPKEGKGLWSKIKTGLTNFSDRMLNMSKANYHHLQSAVDFNSYLNNLNNQSYLNDLNTQVYLNDFNNTGMY